MELSLSFRFVDDDINDKLIGLVKKARVKHAVDGRGIIHYSPADEEKVENDLIASLRNRLFASWQVLSCPQDWTELYKRYMSRHDIPFHEELIGHEVCFLIPRKYRPSLWKLTAQKKHREIGIAR